MYPYLKRFVNWEDNVACIGTACGKQNNIRHLKNDRKTSRDGKPVLTFKYAGKLFNTNEIDLKNLPAVGKVRRDYIAEVIADCIGLEIADDARPVVTAAALQELQRRQGD